jgi:purine-cytosine permease-like protein
LPFLALINMNFKITLASITTFLNKVTKLLVPLVTASLLLGIIFGPDTPYVGDVYQNVTNILNMLGEDALLALVSLVIILSYLNINKD